jgi:hypothetical protein
MSGTKSTPVESTKAEADKSIASTPSKQRKKPSKKGKEKAQPE